MSRSPKTQQRPWRRFFALVIPTLAYWQLRRAWFLLLFITLGLVAAVVVTTSIPLFADVTMTAGLRGLLRGTVLATWYICSKNQEGNNQTRTVSSPVW